LGNGLTTTGTSTAYTVSTALNSNTLYSANIQVTDANNNTASSSVSFDTISGYTFEAEDYDYTSNGITGLFIDNPQTNLYAGLSATAGVDCQHTVGGSNEGHAYRTNSPGLVTEGAGDKARAQYGTGLQDYDLGFNNGGDFGNYTRHYPVGTYNLYLRGSGGNGPQADAASLSVSGGTASLAGTGPYQFSVAGLGWQTYTWCPLKDSGGNLAQITFDGSATSLKVTIDHGNCNENCYLLVPVNTNVPVSTVTITNVYPNGVSLYQSANTLSFNASAPDGISVSDISVFLTATNLYGRGYSSNLTSASGLTVTGSSLSWNVSTPLTTNTVYTAFIQVFDAHGVAQSSSVSFDTIVPAYTFEVEDFDYGSGNYFDNPQTNAYNGLDGVLGVDFNCTQNGGAYNRFGLSTEVANDKTRSEYTDSGLPDYDVGFNNGGNWGNYTRHYPAGNYNIYVRASNGNGNGSSDSGNISLVTSGLGTSSQTLVQLGKFGVQPTGGWQTYAWVPVKDPAGNLAQFTGGSLETLRMTIDGGNCNENFILLSPVDPSTVLQPYVDNIQPDGTGLFQFTNVLSFIVHSQPGTATGNISLNLNGSDVSAGQTFSGTPNIRTVSYTLKPNAYYTAIITVTDANGTVRSTNSFGTFNSTNYQWEAEDYDYNSGSYFDNPQVGSYAGLSAVSGVDILESDVNGPGRGNSYRAVTATDFPDASAGDQARSQFTAVSATDYNLGSFGPGSWANYTRHYPAGTYNVIGRFAEGAANTQATLSQLTSGYGTSLQTSNFLGTFAIPVEGWSTWQWESLRDGNGNLVKVTLDGSLQTLQLGGSPDTTQPEVNVNFLMLVATTPSPKLTATVSGGNIHISFPAQNGYSYQLQYKNNLTDSTWTSLGSALPGDGTVHSMNDSSAIGHRYYRMQIQ